ncbi:hypothetical protein QJQ45_026813 [Haematococcus lacustris]|nr:hypothetical protein QJQ45_026813 [Haematococcus lacustris]
MLKAGKQLHSKIMHNMKDDSSTDTGTGRMERFGQGACVSASWDGKAASPGTVAGLSACVQGEGGSQGPRDMDSSKAPAPGSSSSSSGFASALVKEATTQLKEVLNKIGNGSSGTGAHGQSQVGAKGSAPDSSEEVAGPSSSSGGGSFPAAATGGSFQAAATGGEPAARSRPARPFVPAPVCVPQHRLDKFHKLLEAPVVDVEALRELSWMGIPHPLRPQCWRLLLGYCPPARVRQTATLTRKRTEYTDMLPQYYDIPAAERSEDEQAALRQVMVDVPRTAPAVPFFQEPQIQKSLERLLYIWGIRHPASGYVQGMNDLVTPFLAVFLAEHLPGSLDSWHAGQLTEDVVLSVEADCYWCLCKLVEGIQDHYTYAQPGIQRTVFQLQALAMEMEPELTRRLLAEKLDFIQFAWRWVNCLLVRELPFHLAFRLWDTYLSEGYRLDEYLVQVCAAFLAHWRSALLPLEFQEMIMFLQRLPTADWEEKELAGVLSQAHVYRLKQEEKAQAKGGQTRSPQPPAAGQPR